MKRSDNVDGRFHGKSRANEKEPICGPGQQGSIHPQLRPGHMEILVEWVSGATWSCLEVMASSTDGATHRPEHRK